MPAVMPTLAFETGLSSLHTPTSRKITSSSSDAVFPECTQDSEQDSSESVEDDNRPDQMEDQQVTEGLRRSKRFVRRPSVQTETKYIELMVVNDYDLVSQRGNCSTVYQ